MIQVAHRLFVGDESVHVDPLIRTMSVVHACKEPCHRRALGYTTRAAPKGPEYLWAQRDTDLYLNLVDAPDPTFIDPEVLRVAVRFTVDQQRSQSVLIHCNQGRSRSPAIALLVMAHRGLIPGASYDEAAIAFTGIYEQYAPGVGIDTVMRTNWRALIRDFEDAA